MASMTYSPPDAVASRDLRGQARERHQRVHEVRMPLAPQPGVHAAHRRAHDEAQVIHAEPFGEQAVLRLHHVRVAVARELRAQAVARLAGLAVADAIGQHDEVLASRRAAARRRTARPRTRRRMNCAPVPPVPWPMSTALRTTPLRVLLRRAERAVVNAQLGQRLARAESKILQREVAFAGRRDTRRRRTADSQRTTAGRTE